MCFTQRLVVIVILVSGFGLLFSLCIMFHPCNLRLPLYHELARHISLWISTRIDNKGI